MITNRLQLALERLRSSDWQRFEKISSAFLASEFDSLRTTASPSGDEGRDSELFSPHDEPSVLIQYSVATDWEGKINKTVRRINETFPDARVLVYLSNQEIGSAADSIKKRLRKEHGLSLDVRDRNWFIERVLGSPAREKAAEELSQSIVDPYLSSKGVSPSAPAKLSTPEAYAAVTILGLQWKDDAREKGLTKLAFEALVRSALSNTDSDHRLKKNTIIETICKLLPGHPNSQITSYVDSALQRLTKKNIRHWPKVDEYCLTHEESEIVKNYQVQSALAEEKFLAFTKGICREILPNIGTIIGAEAELPNCIRKATDSVLFERSQAFAIAVQSGTLAALAEEDYTDVLLSELSKSTLPKTKGIEWLGVLKTGVRELLLSEDPAVQAYMRGLSDSYTLFAFLRQTPDVQGAVEKMFAHGAIWLDTSVVLPLFAETLFDGPPGRFTRMISAAREAGLELFITPGFIEEIERHMNRALTCARMQGSWIGEIPYLLERFISSGRSAAGFASWLENFRGRERPEADIGDYLKDEFGVVTRGLEEERRDAPPQLRDALQTIWFDALRDRRERNGGPVDEAIVTRLLDHDIECYCGIIQLRHKERESAFGYSAWWLTIDRKTFDLKGKLREAIHGAPPDSPVLSADFLVNYLAFGPIRRMVGKAKETQLPLIMGLGNSSYLTPEILKEAETLREEIKDLPDRIIRRRVRDHLDRARRRLGPIARAGLVAPEEDLIT